MNEITNLKVFQAPISRIIEFQCDEVRLSQKGIELKVDIPEAGWSLINEVVFNIKGKSYKFIKG